VEAPPAESPGLWTSPTPPAPEPAAPAPWSATEAPGAPPEALPTPGGFASGDPLLGAGDPLLGAGGTAFPPGYTSPPPPGAGGPDYAPPPPAAFGSGSPAPGTFVLAGWWLRVGAAIIDGLIVTAGALIIMAPLGIGAFATGNSDDATGFFAFIAAFIVMALVFAVVALAYAPVMMGKTNGKTIGRMATGIRVVRADGQPITIGFAALREVAVKALLIGAVGGSFTFGLASLLDVLWPLWDDENRALHDLVVNTRTVVDR
jgi:uncharacterized RDD family membrane protein YckC